MPALSLISKTYEGILAIYPLESTAITLEGRSNTVYAVIFSPGGKLVAPASGDQAVKLWDPATGSLPKMLSGHPGPVEVITFPPDSKLVASASGDRTVMLWDSTTGSSLQVLEGHSSVVRTVIFSPNGKLAASASDYQTDSTTGSPLQIPEGHSGGVNAVIFSLSGKLVASASRDQTVRLWDPTTGSLLQTLEICSDPGTEAYTSLSIAFSPDSKLVASAS
ncbi:hypothetical protein FGG08_006416 [Glutinoglossum americanum]|uniref:WD40 repeat-like protein n=1 Tax=Glutinoglossum americanum TaxID=1670608 RepID=A0A9P8L1Y2_9PEZI|nr:hypothetical protein FGG08_006416 [Glutinoglossum americanum]